MNNEERVFNNYLRDYQKPIFNEIQQSGSKVLLKAPMDFGKTYLACVYTSSLFISGKIRSVTFAIQNYQMRDRIISDLRKVSLSDQMIVCLEGKERAFIPVRKGRKQTRIGTIRKEIHNLNGQVIDVDFIKKRWPNSNPYLVLMELQKYADIVIVHQSMLRSNKKVRKTDLLIVDDADLMNRDEVFSIAKYEVYQNHLQAAKDMQTDAGEILSKLSRYEDKLPYSCVFLRHYLSYFPENPGDMEIDSVLETQLKSEKNQSNPIARMFTEKELEGKNEDEKLHYLLSKKQTDIMIGISQASNPLTWKSYTDKLKLRIKDDAEHIGYKIEQELDYAISAHIDYRLESFLTALFEPSFHVKPSRVDAEWQLLEINLSNGSNFMDVVNQYAKVLWISATADPDDPKFKEFILVQSTFDPHSEHKHIVEISRDKLPDLLFTLKEHNVFVITGSGVKASDFQKEYGGDVITAETYDVIMRKAMVSKGNIAISYVNGAGSRGVDDLAGLFDAVIVESWIYRSVTQRDGKFYDDAFYLENLKDANQIIGRIMRGSSDHILFLIKDEAETGSKLKEYMTTENPSWQTYKGLDSISGLIERIPERVQKEQKITILRKETRTLRDGSKELIYRAKATDEEIDHAPDYMEI